MTLSLELPGQLESELSTEAGRLGLTLPEYALRVLATGTVVGSVPKTGSELVEYWRTEGLIGSRSDIEDSQRHARELRENAERRTKES